jgi:single-strand DNA-binding protein
MASFNKVTICGFLGRDPELKYTPQGTANCKLSVASTEKRQDKEFTTWFRITVWGKQGELCNEYLAKGSQVYVEGRLRQEEYTDREGQKRTTLEVNASDVQFLGRKGEGGNGRDEAPSPARREALKTPETVAIDVEEDSDIPF